MEMSVWQAIAMLLVFIYVPLCLWRIFRRSGQPGWLGLFAVVPGGLFVLLGVLAFRRWPIEDSVPGAGEPR